ncbi:FMN-binding protein [Clostridia bacterium]|nr:FMN-binding protein [Clostridia bacterium]
MKKKKLNRSDVQFAFIIMAILITVNHSLVEVGKGISWISSGYIHYVCPICGVTTIYQFFASSADWLTKLTNPVAWVILGSIMVAVLFGPIFCGWICPFGGFQDLVSNNLGKRIVKNKHNRYIDKKVDKKLRYLRYVSLAIVFYMTAKSAVTVLENVNPYHALLNLFVGEFAVIGLIVLLIVALASVFIARPWCKYLCPYGALLGLFNIVRVKAIVRNEPTCIHCKKCSRACPMNIEVAESKIVRDHQCISCLECTSDNACPVEDTVQLKGTKGLQEVVEINAKNIIAVLLIIVSLSIFTAAVVSDKTTESSAESVIPLVSTQLDGSYESGVYTGEGTGFNTGLMVEITIDNNQITNIEITSHNETIGYYEAAFETIPNSIITEQSTEVDSVSSATRSSEGIMEAVSDALEKALITTSNTTEVESEGVEVVESEREVSEPVQQDTTSQNENSELEIEPEIEPTSEEDSIQVDDSGRYADGVYTGVGVGYGGELTVEVTVENGSIMSVEVVEDNETPRFLSRASSILSSILDRQSTDVDTVSSATMSSTAILDAVDQALEGAQ